MQWSIQSLVHILELGFEVFHLNFDFFFNNNKMKTNNDKQGVAGWTCTCDQNKKEKNWTRQLLSHENPTGAKKACLSCEQGRVEVDVFNLEILLEKSYFLNLF